MENAFVAQYRRTGVQRRPGSKEWSAQIETNVKSIARRQLINVVAAQTAIIACVHRDVRTNFRCIHNADCAVYNTSPDNYLYSLWSSYLSPALCNGDEQASKLLACLFIAMNTRTGDKSFSFLSRREYWLIIMIKLVGTSTRSPQYAYDARSRMSSLRGTYEFPAISLICRIVIDSRNSATATRFVLLLSIHAMFQ